MKKYQQEASNCNLFSPLSALDGRIEIIQMLIPLGLEAVAEILQAQVEELVGPKYGRKNQLKRWGYNQGSVFLGEQKLPIKVPRVRDVDNKQEIEIEAYKKLQQTGIIDQACLKRLINGISTRKFENAAMSIPESFGISKSSVSRKFITASAQKLAEFFGRDLSKQDIIAIFMDGKSFAENEIIIALGVTMEGQKIVLGFIESATENASVCKDFLESLKDRGLGVEQEILFVVDGAKGLKKGIEQAFGQKALIQRCHWHKIENITGYLAAKHQPPLKKKLRQALKEPTESKARKALKQIEHELSLLNKSAVSSLNEGLEELLTLHKLGLVKELGQSFRTTNCIESINSQLEGYCGRVKHWKNSDQRQRWVATALLEIEPNLRTVMGYRYLPQLRLAMKKRQATKSLIMRSA